VLVGVAAGHGAPPTLRQRVCWYATDVELAERFWRKVAFTRDCWVWAAFCLPNGYGWFSTTKAAGPAYAHRVGYELQVGPIPPGLQVLHTCDNPPCVRADHLFVGTQRDNVLDAMAKGRHRHWPRVAD
jgi:HNH endonuclease